MSKHFPMRGSGSFIKKLTVCDSVGDVRVTFLKSAFFFFFWCIYALSRLIERDEVYMCVSRTRLDTGSYCLLISS